MPRGVSAAATLAVLLVVPCCTTTVVVPPDGSVLRTPADPATVAWALAWLCRDAHPSSDPLPFRGPVPVVRSDARTFSIAIGRYGVETPYRCETNGRLPEPAATALDDGRMLWVPPRFQPARDHTVAPGSADRLEIEIAASDGETDVRIVVAGDAASPELVRRLVAAVDVLTATEESARLLLEGTPGRAALRAETELALLKAEGVTGLGRLLAPLHAHLATARVRLGELADARNALSSAIASAPRVRALRIRAADLDVRLARSTEAERAMRVLSSDPLGGPATRVAAARASIARATLAANRSTRETLGAARRLLAEGDVEGAAAWSRTARTCPGERFGGIDIELFRARGDHRTAFSLGIERLVRFGYDADLVIGMADDAEAYGDPATGLRLIARHWNALVRDRSEDALAVAERLARSAGPDLSTRVALAEGNDIVASLALRTASPAGQPDQIDRHRLASLRALANRHPTTRPITTDGFELAPGVSPIR